MTGPRSNKAWLRRHVTDSYVRRAREAGYRSRAAYKLMEIDDRERIFRIGDRVIDLGAAPGSWSQLAAQRVGRGGRVIAVDLLPIAPISAVSIVQGDFRAPELRNKVLTMAAGHADVVLSDLAPNVSGISLIDQAKISELVELASDFAISILKKDGVFVTKVFHGEAYGELVTSIQGRFRRLSVRKPGASRGESRETYLVCRDPLRVPE